LKRDTLSVEYGLSISSPSREGADAGERGRICGRLGFSAYEYLPPHVHRQRRESEEHEDANAEENERLSPLLRAIHDPP